MKQNKGNKQNIEHVGHGHRNMFDEMREIDEAEMVDRGCDPLNIKSRMRGKPVVKGFDDALKEMQKLEKAMIQGVYIAGTLSRAEAIIQEERQEKLLSVMGVRFCPYSSFMEHCGGADAVPWDWWKGGYKLFFSSDCSHTVPKTYTHCVEIRETVMAGRAYLINTTTGIPLWATGAAKKFIPYVTEKPGFVMPGEMWGVNNS
jgi:hypothetical protein